MAAHARGEQDSQVELLTTTSPGKRVPATHPIREIKRLADQALAKLDSTFDAMYSSIGRPWDGSYLIMAAYNLTRMTRLLRAAAA